MKTPMFLAVVVCSVTLFSGYSEVSAAQPKQPVAAKGTTSDEQAIRVANARWLELIRKKDTTGITQLYTEDGVALPPNHKVTVGHQAIGQWWASQMKAPGFAMTFGTDQLVCENALNNDPTKKSRNLLYKSDNTSF